MDGLRRFTFDGRVITPVISTITGATTRELMKATGGSPARTALGFRRDWTLEFRICGHWETGEEDPETWITVDKWIASGGATLTARKPAPRHGSVFSQYQTSLSPGWVEEDLHRAVCRAHGWFRDRAVIEARRDEVYDFAETREIDYEELEKAEAERGKDSSYEGMMEEDCDFWMEWLEMMPEKGEEG